jgi:hypothetical protein
MKISKSFKFRCITTPEQDTLCSQLRDCREKTSLEKRQKTFELCLSDFPFKGIACSDSSTVFKQFRSSILKFFNRLKKGQTGKSVVFALFKKTEKSTDSFRSNVFIEKKHF